MYSLMFKLVKSVSENYYEKLLNNYTKKMYEYDNILKDLYSDGFNRNEILDPRYGLGKNDSDLIIEFDKKFNNLLYEDMLNKNYSKVICFQNDYTFNEKILNKLIENKKYDVLYDILTQKDLFETKGEIIGHNLNHQLKGKIFPNYNLFFPKFKDNKENLDLLANISFTNYENPDRASNVTKMYVETLFDKIQNYGFNGFDLDKGFSIENQNKLNDLLNQTLKNNYFVSKDDLINNLDMIINKSKVENQKDDRVNKMILVATLNFCEIEKYDQYKILMDNFSKEDDIFKIFMLDCVNVDTFFDKNNYLYIDENNKIDVSNLNQEKIDLLKELLNNIKEEPKSSNQEIMISKLKEHFNFENDINLNYIKDVKVVEFKKIIDLTKEQFNDVFVSLDEERLDKFNKDINSL